MASVCRVVGTFKVALKIWQSLHDTSLGELNVDDGVIPIGRSIVASFPPGMGSAPHLWSNTIRAESQVPFSQ